MILMRIWFQCPAVPILRVSRSDFVVVCIRLSVFGRCTNKECWPLPQSVCQSSCRDTRQMSRCTHFFSNPVPSLLWYALGCPFWQNKPKAKVLTAPSNGVPTSCRGICSLPVIFIYRCTQRRCPKCVLNYSKNANIIKNGMCRIFARTF